MTDYRYALEGRGINKTLGGRKVLEDVHIEIEAGSYAGLIGPNGGGKTTLLRILLGLLPPDTGEIRLFDQPEAQFTERYRLGYVPQRAAEAEFYAPATVGEVVESGRVPRRTGFFSFLSRGDHEAVRSALEEAEVAELENRRIGSLSGGERQRVYIARALASEPSLLVLDEPTVGVDIASQERFFLLLKRLNRERGLTIIFVTHDIGAIGREADSLICLHHRLVCHGPPEDFVKEEFLTELYGRPVGSVLHRH